MLKLKKNTWLAVTLETCKSQQLKTSFFLYKNIAQDRKAVKGYIYIDNLFILFFHVYIMISFFEMIAQELKTVTMKQLPQQNLQNDTDASQVKDMLLYIAAVFSIASFVLGLLNIMISSWRRCNVSNNSSEPSGMENEKKSYQTLMKNTIYTGPAHVVMNADTVERNFSVVMTTASCDNMSTFPDATEPKSVEEKRKQPNGTVEIYESLK